MKHTVTLEIAGTKFKLVADADAQHLSDLAAMVNERVAKLEQSGKTAPTAQVLALVALGLADDLTTSRRKLREMEQLTRKTLQNVIARIDDRLTSPQQQTAQSDLADALDQVSRDVGADAHPDPSDGHD